MTRSMGPFKLNNAWVRIGWLTATGLVAVGAVLGFVVLGREQQNGRPLDVWAGICRGLGVTSDAGPAGEPQPPLRTPTRIAWTRDTLTLVAGGDVGLAPDRGRLEAGHPDAVRKGREARVADDAADLGGGVVVRDRDHRIQQRAIARV